MFKELVRPAKVFGLHGLPMGAKLVAQEGRLQTFVARFGGRFASKELILQRTLPLNHMGARDTTLRSVTFERDSLHAKDVDEQDTAGPYSASLCLTRDGASYWFDNIRSDFWRCFSRAESDVENLPLKIPNVASQAARMLGEYHEILAGLPSNKLREETAEALATRESLEELHRAVLHDPHGRSNNCHTEIRFAMDHAHYSPHLLTVGDRGAGVDRQQRNGGGISHSTLLRFPAEACMVDLKTAFPHRYPYRQLGSVRNVGADISNDDSHEDPDSSLILKARLVEGYLGVIRWILLPDEFRQLAISGKWLAYELGIRFLTDHLLGDKRFPVDIPSQNLHRARKQFRLAFRIDSCEEELNSRFLYPEIPW